MKVPVIKYSYMTYNYRAVGRSENPGVPVLFGGHNLLPLVEIGLTDLPKSWHPVNPRLLLSEQD
jgi:hypothetical protein